MGVDLYYCEKCQECRHCDSFKYCPLCENRLDFCEDCDDGLLCTENKICNSIAFLYEYVQKILKRKKKRMKDDDENELIGVFYDSVWEIKKIQKDKTQKDETDNEYYKTLKNLKLVLNNI
jgi:hypothetical protein